MLADAWGRISERRRKKATTATTLAQAQDILSNLHGDSAKRLVLRVTTSIATTYYVRAADALSAKTNKLQDVPLCDPVGEVVASDTPARRGRVPLADVLAGTLELLPLATEVVSNPNLIISADGGIKLEKHPAGADEYQLPLDTTAEVAPSREQSP